MIRKWCAYLALLVGLVVLYLSYQGWLAWILLMAALWMPVFSLAVSLPAILTIYISPSCSGTVPVLTPIKMQANVKCPLPMPVFRCRIRVVHKMTGQKWLLEVGEDLPTEHCGQLTLSPEKSYVYDYLCLFRFKIRNTNQTTMILRPQPVKMPVPQDLDRYMSRAWRPKHGGGFAENHELRLYRPGDGMNTVHWKLSAKTGKLIVREAMEPALGRVVLSLDLKGDCKTMNAVLGKLLYLGSHMLEKELRYEIHALTGEGHQAYLVGREPELVNAVDQLLCSSPAGEGSILEQPIFASWRHHIGGDADEN